MNGAAGRASGALLSAGVVEGACQRLCARPLRGPWQSWLSSPVGVVTIHIPGPGGIERTAQALQIRSSLPCLHAGPSATRWFQFVVSSVRIDFRRCRSAPCPRTTRLQRPAVSILVLSGKWAPAWAFRDCRGIRSRAMLLVNTILPGDIRQRRKRVWSSRKGGGILTAMHKSFKP